MAVMTLSVILFKRLGVSNTDIAFYSSWLYLPWVIKPLWSPIVELFSRKRVWILAMQLLIGAAFASVALTLQVNNFFKWSLIFFWLLAFNSATHDIAADGFYILALDSHKQSIFVGMRSTFYRLSMIAGQGLLVMLAGAIENMTGLGEVTLEVSAKKIAEEKQIFPEDFAIPELNKNESSGKIIIHPDAKIAIPIKDVSLNKFNTIREAVKKNNGIEQKNEIAKNYGAKSDGFFAKYLKSPLEKFIISNFGERKKSTGQSQTGNCGVLFFALKNPPSNEKTIINVDFIGGEKSIKLIEGSRLEFSKADWNKPKALLFQLDRNLKQEGAAKFAIHSGNARLAWTIVFFVLAGLFSLFFFYHLYFLPHPLGDGGAVGLTLKSHLLNFINPFLSFFKKENIVPALLFLLLYRLGEAQLVKLSSPFLLDDALSGGLSMSTGALGFVYGTVGVLLLTFGGILGGVTIASGGLKKWLFPMALAINLPDLVYVYMSYYQPSNIGLITTLVGIEQFGYGFGFSAYMLFMVYYAGSSDFKTSHYAIMTGFMALGMMLPGMWSGWLQELIGYRNFFIWVCISTLPGFCILPFLKVATDFGIKKHNSEK